MKQLTILLIDQLPQDYKLIRANLKVIPKIKFELDWVKTFEEGQQRINDDTADIYLIENNLDDGKGLQLLTEARDNGIEKPIIILTVEEELDTDLEAYSAGADDYIVKSKINEHSLQRSIRYTYEKYISKQKIAINEIRYRRLFERSIDAIAIVDSNLTIQEANQSLHTLFGKKPEKYKGKSFAEFFKTKEDFERFENDVKQKGLLKDYEATLLTKKKETVFASINTLLLFDLENNPSSYQIIIKNLTQEKRSKQRLIRSEKLATTGRISRSIAHEVRNPLTNINLALDHLVEELPEDGDYAIYTEIISRNSKRINDLITELLNSAKPSDLQLSRSSVNQVVQEAIELARDRLHLNGIKLHTKIKEEFELDLDKEKFKTAILNLIINAIEANDKRNGEIYIRIFSSLSEVHIEIKDNGKGIEKEFLMKLFDPFFTGKTEGMGLGLTSTQNIIIQHGGNIDVDSEVGKGTIFIVNLPKR
ncbi:MAG: ATP-binding protein [Vicingaceae bacterium]